MPKKNEEQPPYPAPDGHYWVKVNPKTWTLNPIEEGYDD